MASGRPLLASSDGDSGVATLVKTAGCGLCIKPGETEHLAEAILDLYRNPALRATMGRQGRRYAEENHSKHAAVARYNELLQRISA